MSTRRRICARPMIVHSVHVMRARGGRRVLVAGLLMVATVACDSGVHYSVPDTQTGHETSARPDAATTPASPVRHPAKATEAAEAPAAGRTAAPSETRSRSTTAPAAPTCTTGDVAAAEGRTSPQVGGGLPGFAAEIVLRNRSGSTCRLSGWPGLTFFGDGSLHACTTADPPGCESGPVSTSGIRPFKVSRSGAAAPPAVLLAPGHTTSFVLHSDDSCPGVGAPYGVDIRLPGGSRPLTLVPGPNLSPCDEKLDVTAFGPAV
ncbi:DUF4232 domain-containing protein [Streptomyces sp. NPDC008092]|uniref:DUF4232 domain-containing protein n=1 Tax=Streptomyces sp. NPDC008092 TaxID=3364808 RepID=UPI0036EBEC39